MPANWNVSGTNIDGLYEYTYNGAGGRNNYVCSALGISLEPVWNGSGWAYWFQDGSVWYFQSGSHYEVSPENYPSWNPNPGVGFGYPTFEYAGESVEPITVTTIPAELITSTSARLIMTAESNEIWQAGLYRGASSPPATWAGYTSSTGSTYWADVSGLSPGTTYYFRGYADNSLGSYYGSILSFTTLSAGRKRRMGILGVG